MKGYTDAEADALAEAMADDPDIMAAAARIAAEHRTVFRMGPAPHETLLRFEHVATAQRYVLYLSALLPPQLTAETIRTMINHVVAHPNVAVLEYALAYIQAATDHFQMLHAQPPGVA